MVIVDLLLQHHARRDLLARVKVASSMPQNQSYHSTVDGTLAGRGLPKQVRREAEVLDRLRCFPTRKPVLQFPIVLNRLGVGRLLVGLPEDGAPEPAS